MNDDDARRLAGDQDTEQRTEAMCQMVRMVGAVVAAYYHTLQGRGLEDPLLGQLVLDFADAEWAALGVRARCDHG